MMVKKILILVSLMYLISVNTFCAVMKGEKYTISDTQASVVIATVDDTTITHADLYQRLFNLYGKQVLSQMIEEIIVKSEAQKNNIKLSEAEIDARLKEVKDPFGSDKAFLDFLTSRGLTVDSLKEQIRLQLYREKLIIKDKKIKVTKKEIEDFFATNKEKLSTPEQIRIRHILVKTEEEAKDLIIALRAGADFAIMASAKSQDPASRDRGGDMGFFSKGMLLPEIEQVTFALKVGEISQPVKTSLGYHIFKVEEKREAQEAKLDKQMQQRIGRMILQQRINEAYPTWLNEVRQKRSIKIQ